MTYPKFQILEPDILAEYLTGSKARGNVTYYTKPCASFGYYRGTPVYGGDIGTQGPISQGIGEFAFGQGVEYRPPDYRFMYYLIAGVGLVGFSVALLCQRSRLSEVAR